jgi:hypothetical protein
MGPTHEDDSHDQRLAEAVTAYLKAAEAGQAPSSHEWLARHPDLGDDLSEFFAAREQIESLAAPLRAAVSAQDTTAEPTPATAPPLAVGRTVGDYELLEEIARGGMGVVYKARQVSLDRIVALKMILAGQFAGDAQVQRFHTEAESVGHLDHPNIVAIYEVGQHDGLHYFSMKLMEGGSLAQVVADRPWSVADREGQQRAARLVASVARAVHHAHQRGILHRDLKPANVLLDAAGQPHVSDFGLAKRIEGDSNVTQTGAIVGTPSYMAPEQASGKKGAVTTLADVYSLGAILYELLARRPPFLGETPLETIRELIEREPVPPSQYNPRLDRDLEAICLKCLEKAPGRRYSSAHALADDLDHWLAGEPIQARPASLARLMWAWLRKNLRATLWTGLIGLACGGLYLLTWINLLRLTMGRSCAELYARDFPSMTPPILATQSSLADALLVPLAVATVIGFLGMGLFTVLLVRPKDRWGDLVAGLATGLVAGALAFTGGGAWKMVLTFVVLPAMSDLHLLGEAARLEETPPGGAAGPPGQTSGRPATALLDKYPDLRAVPPEKRGEALARKIGYDVALDTPLWVWAGMVLAMVSFAFVSTAEALLAGYLLRQRGQARLVVLPYLELLLPGLFVLYSVGVAVRFVVMGITSDPSVHELDPAVLVLRHFSSAAPYFTWQAFLVKLLLAGLAIGGALLRWPGPVRAALYAGWLVLFLRVTGAGAPWWVDVVVCAGVVCVLGRHWLRNRRERLA